MSSPSSRKRRATDAANALERVRELALVAAQNAPEPSYLDRPHKSSASAQPLITERQREKVVKYINELAEDFELCVQTGTLACNYFDRYVASLVGTTSTAADKQLVQMIASTCLLIAAKFSDRKLPPLSELEKVHHGKVSGDEFAGLELKILQGLRWKLHVPLPHDFTESLRTLCAGAPFNAAIEDRMLFFIDLSVYGYHFLTYSAASIAAAAILTAWKFSDAHECLPRFIHPLARAVNLEPRQLSACVNALVKYYQSCFPESREAAQQNLFTPISCEDECDYSSSSQAETPQLLRRDAPDMPSDPTRAPSVPPTPMPEAAPSPLTIINKQQQQQQPDPERRTPDSVLESGLLLGI